MAEHWTEERLDDLKQEVKSQGRRMDEGFRDLRKEVGALRAETHAQIGGLRKDLHVEIGGLRTEIGGLRTEMRTEIGGVRTEIGGVREEMNTRFGQLDARLDNMVYALVGFGAAMFAAMASLVAAVIISL